MRYIQPGQPIPPAPLPTANSYLVPTAVAQQLSGPPDPTPPTPQAEAGNGPTDPHHATLITEWRRQHGPGWVRAEALHPAVRELIDARGRVATVRQKLPRLVAACPELEAKVVGNRAERVVFYRATEVETAGLEAQ